MNYGAPSGPVHMPCGSCMRCRWLAWCAWNDTAEARPLRRLTSFSHCTITWHFLNEMSMCSCEAFGTSCICTGNVQKLKGFMTDFPHTLNPYIVHHPSTIIRLTASQDFHTVSCTLPTLEFSIRRLSVSNLTPSMEQSLHPCLSTNKK